MHAKPTLDTATWLHSAEKFTFICVFVHICYTHFHVSIKMIASYQPLGSEPLESKHRDALNEYPSVGILCPLTTIETLNKHRRCARLKHMNLPMSFVLCETRARFQNGTEFPKRDRISRT